MSPSLRVCCYLAAASLLLAGWPVGDLQRIELARLVHPHPRSDPALTQGGVCFLARVETVRFPSITAMAQVMSITFSQGASPVFAISQKTKALHEKAIWNVN